MVPVRTSFSTSDRLRVRVVILRVRVVILRSSSSYGSPTRQSARGPSATAHGIHKRSTPREREISLPLTPLLLLLQESPLLLQSVVSVSIRVFEKVVTRR